MTSEPHYAMRKTSSDAVETIQRAFEEFLTVPTALIVAFVLLAAGTYALDQFRPAALEPLRAFIAPRFFPDARSTATLIAGIATAIISVTSITVTLLLLVLQQSAAAMTTQVFDQFLRRRSNQLFFGFFVGLALFALITEMTINDRFVPVYGGTLVFLLTAMALYVLVLLLYTIINQTRPSEITAAIHDRTLAARMRELDVIAKTRASLAGTFATHREVVSSQHGFVVRVDVDRLCSATRKHDGGAIVLCVSIGAYVSFRDVVAIVHATDASALDALQKAVVSSLQIKQRRDIAWDAIYGVEELQTIGWTSISSAKSNPTSGLMIIRATRDLLARWAADGPPARDPDAPAVVYVDATIDRVFDAFETYAAASSESKQHQAFAEVAETFAVLFSRLPSIWQLRAEDSVRRVLACAGNQLPTLQVDQALHRLADTLQRCHRDTTAREVERVLERLNRACGGGDGN